ncbi:MAG TPA: class I SAM-dependent methyltransferase [Terriglobia bacterium]|nr:class I SAM-dependent methyltransferase [Terriglobia bacterium]
MKLYTDHILPRILNLAMGAAPIARERVQCLQDARGVVLEVGFGSGHNLPFYPNAVERVIAIDPSAVSAKLARGRIEAAPFPVEYLPLSGESIDAADASVDTVVSTFTLCTIPDPSRALSEMRRVLRPDGAFLFLEHGRSPDPAVERWQNRLNATQQRLFGGCHLNRDMEQLIVASGFRIDNIEKFYGQGPRPFAFLYRGEARKG